jgi:hypothetical protein
MVLIVIGISNSIFLVLISIFFSISPLLMVFFQLNPCFLICIDNIFRFSPSTFNFLFLSFAYLSNFLWLSILSFIVFFFNDNNDSNLVPLLLIFYCFSCPFVNVFIFFNSIRQIKLMALFFQ